MTITTYTFSYSTDFVHGLNTAQLHKEIASSSITVLHISTIISADNVEIQFEDELSFGEQITLGSVVSAHWAKEPENKFVKDNMSDQWKKYLLSSAAPTDIKIGTSFMFLLMGRYFVNPDQANFAPNQDFVRMSVVDVEGIYYPAGTVLVVKCEEYLTVAKQWMTFDCYGQRSQLVPGLYVRLEIVHSGEGTITGVSTVCLSKKDE